MDTLNERLKLARERLGLTQEEMAEAVGAKKRGYQENEKGNTIPSSRIIEGFIRRGISANWLVAGIGDMLLSSQQFDTKRNSEYLMVPNLQDDLTIISAVPFSSQYLKSHQYKMEKLALIVSNGDSMEPTINSDDSLLINMEATTPTDGNIFVLRLGENLYPKRVQLLVNGDLTLISDNKDYLPQIITDDEVKQLSIIGQVIWIGKTI